MPIYMYDEVVSLSGALGFMWTWHLMKDVCRGVMLIGYSQLIPNLNLQPATMKGLPPSRALHH